MKARAQQDVNASYWGFLGGWKGDARPGPRAMAGLRLHVDKDRAGSLDLQTEHRHPSGDIKDTGQIPWVKAD